MKQASAVNFIPFTSTRIRSFVRSFVRRFLSFSLLFHYSKVIFLMSKSCSRSRAIGIGTLAIVMS